MSLRARLALVLAGVLVGPLVVAGVVLAVVVPRAQDRADDAAVRRALAATSAYLAQRCAALGDAARAAALDLSGALAAGRPLQAEAADVVRARPPGEVRLIVSAGGRVVAASGGPPSDAQVQALPVASCARGAAPPSGPPAQVESVPVTDGAGAEVARVIAVGPLDGPAVDAVRARLGLGEGLALTLDGRVVSSSGPSEPPAPGPRTAGVDGGRRFRAAPPAPGVPYGLVAWTPTEARGLRLDLVALAVAAVAGCAALLLVVTRRLTRPLLGLVEVADRLRRGDLAARRELTGTDGNGDEVDRLTVAVDALAERLEADADELAARREALQHAAGRLGEALARTHDLDGLLQTVLDAARDAGHARAGAALLGTARTLEERAVSSVGPPVGPATLERLAALARSAVEQGGAVREGDPAPAVAVPLRAADRMLGALALIRPEGSPPLDDDAVAAVEAIAAPAGIAVRNVLEHEETRRLSVTDPLTGAGNFRQLSTTLAREVERATRFSRPLSVVMLDLDHFKGVNDAHGHAFGDGVLREFARRLQDCLREVDTVARYGGEEFAVVLPETGPDGAAAVTARIVAAIRARPFTVGSVSQAVTVSAGVASFPDHGRTAGDILRAADAALYVAKEAGRDRWCLAEVVLPGQEPPDDDPGELADVPAAPRAGSG